MGRGRVGLESRRAPCRIGRAGHPCGSSGGGMSNGNARSRLAATRKKCIPLPVALFLLRGIAMR
eukprot:9493522-Pyramimonas_sp.AAC.1